jgi:hypothetical protein
MKPVGFAVAAFLAMPFVADAAALVSNGPVSGGGARAVAAAVAGPRTRR